MRIISDFHDYYDTAQAFGHDPICVYQRSTSTIAVQTQNIDILNRQIPAPVQWWRYNLRPIEKMEKHLLGFCGKLYPFLTFENYEHKPALPESKIGTHYLFSVDALRSELERNGFFAPKVRINELKERKTSLEHLGNFFDDWCDYESTVFEQLKVPAFLITSVPYRTYSNHNPQAMVEMELNPKLQTLGFFKVKGAFQAFQEIEQFLSGVLALQQPEIVEIADADMLVKKGFNEWSFKTLPGKKSRKHK